jgi:hypothetical protein
MIPELLGRLPVISTLNQLSQKDWRNRDGFRKLICEFREFVTSLSSS